MACRAVNAVATPVVHEFVAVVFYSTARDSLARLEVAVHAFYMEERQKLVDVRRWQPILLLNLLVRINVF